MRRRPAAVSARRALAREPLFLGVPEPLLYAEIGIVAVLWLLAGLHLVFGLGLLVGMGGLVHAPLMDLARRDPRLPARRLRALWGRPDRYAAFTALVPRVSLAALALVGGGCTRADVGHGTVLAAAPLLGVALGFAGVLALARRRVAVPGTDRLLPWRTLVGRDLVLTDQHGLMAVWAVRGPDLHSTTDDELAALAQRVETFLGSLGPEWTVTFEQTVEPEKAAQPPALPATPVREALLERHRQLRAAPRARVRTHLTLVYEPRPPFERGLRAFHDVVASLPLQLPELRPARLEGDALVRFLAATLAATASAPPHPVDLAQLLARPVRATALGLELAGAAHAATIEITGYPETVYLGLLDLLPRMTTRCRLTSVVTPLAPLEARKRLDAQRRAWGRRRLSLLTVLTRQALQTQPVRDRDGRDYEESRFVYDVLEQAADALAALEAGSDRFADLSQTITVYGEPAAVEEALSVLQAELDRRHVAHLVDPPTALETFFDHLPGRRPGAARRRLQSLAALVRTLPLLDPWQGHAEIGYPPLGGGPPLLEARLAGSSLAFGFTPYAEGVGHQLIVGPTGAGKSTLLNAQALAFFGTWATSRVIVFDHGRSSVRPARFAGAAVYDLGRDTLSLQPLVHADTPHGFQAGLDFLERACALGHGSPPSARARQHLREALEALADEPPPRRTLTNLVDLVQDAAVQLALGDLLAGGPLGALLDGAPDDPAFAHDARYLVIETERIFELDDRLALPTLHALLQRVTRLLREEQPTLLLIDECWVLLRHPLFRDLIPLWLATARKKNAAVVLATQSIAQLDDPALLTMITQQCPTKVYLPDRSAEQRPEPYRHMGLSAQQIARIARAQPRREIYLTRPEGNALVDLEIRGAFAEILFGGAPAATPETLTQGPTP